jgi:hypothetical protein
MVSPGEGGCSERDKTLDKITSLVSSGSNHYTLLGGAASSSVRLDVPPAEGSDIDGYSAVSAAYSEKLAEDYLLLSDCFAFSDLAVIVDALR